MNTSEVKVDIINKTTNEVTQIKEKEITTKTKESSDTQTIIIPANMSKKDAATELMKQWTDEETVITDVYMFENWAHKDVLVAIKKVAERVFGWVQGKTLHTMFGDIKPVEIKILTNIVNGVEEYEDAFYGQFQIDSWENAKVNIQIINKSKVTVTCDIKKKFKNRSASFFNEINKHLKEHSIYKGKNLVYGKDGEFEFIDVKENHNVILNEDEENVINNFIIKPITKPGKRSVLFLGSYGTGKTETAMRVGLEGNKKGLTFCYCRNPNLFPNLLSLIKNYQPAIIFLEDVDNIGGGEERDTDMNNLLNILDGIESKGHTLITIFTTNHESRINKALRRPGRIDQIVKFSNPNKITIGKIYQRYFNSMDTDGKLDYALLANSTPDVQGAVIAEICKRAIELAIQVNDGVMTNELVEASIISMQFQIEYMKEDPEHIENDAVVIVNKLSKFITTTLVNELVQMGVI